MGWESHLYLLPFVCQRALSYRTQYVWQTTCTWVGPLSAHGHWYLGWSTRGPWVLHHEGCISGFDPLGRVGVGMRCTKKYGEWLGSLAGPHTKEVWTGRNARLCSKALISFGITHFCRVYKDVTCYPLFRKGATNAAGKVLSRH
jgi:hypothetical protein